MLTIVFHRGRKRQIAVILAPEGAGAQVFAAGRFRQSREGGEFQPVSALARDHVDDAGDRVGSDPERAPGGVRARIKKPPSAP